MIISGDKLLKELIESELILYTDDAENFFARLGIPASEVHSSLSRLSNEGKIVSVGERIVSYSNINGKIKKRKVKKFKSC